MHEEQRIPVVPLEAGGGPENPPCPACGVPLFGWIDRLQGLAGPVRRCESCGLGVVGEPNAEEALEELERLASNDALTIANRDGVAAWIGGAGWAGLEPGSRHLFTPEAARRLLARGDRVVSGARWAPWAAIGITWQTVVNGFTFGRNLALGAAGRSTAVPAGSRWQRWLDWVITVAVALPAVIVALALELPAAAAGRGAAVTLRFARL